MKTKRPNYPPSVTAILKECGNSKPLREMVLAALLSPGELIRTCYITGSGSYARNQDYHDRLKTILRKHGIPYSEGNDAPRGGKTGQWVKVSDSIAGINLRAFLETESLRREEEERKKEEKIRANLPTPGDGTPTPAEWVALPERDRHPAPKHIHAMKYASGLTWRAFEKAIGGAQ